MATNKDDSSEKESGENGSSGFGKKLREYIDKGVEASKKGLKTAGSAISDFGDKSVLQIEISQLKTKLSKEYETLGEVTYSLLSGAEGAVSKTSKGVEPSLEKINSLSKDIKKHEKQIKDIDKAAESKKNEENAKK